MMSRRAFLASGAAIAAAPRAGAAAEPLHISSNSYSWHVYYQREKKNFGADLDAGLADVAKSSLNGYEPGIGGPGDVDRLVPLLKKHGLEMRSIYCGSVMHDPAQAEKSIERIMAVAEKVKAVGTKIIVTNPNPIGKAKTDEQLKTQAGALQTLGEKLSGMGLTLAYHNHDPEMRQEGREFHAMMKGTDPKAMTLCLDAHWVWRGSGNSSKVLSEVVKLYGPRVSELHIRQSAGGVWSETLGEGDIDYPEVVKGLVEARVKPLLVMEIAVEKGTPNTMDSVEAHRRSVEYARKVFAPLG
jgi:inosose dehydratase